MLKLYPRLSVQNLRKNYRVTVPYILSGSGIIMMYYMLYALTVGTSQSSFYGVTSAGTMLGLGIYVIGIFGAIFLFYTNSFLMKRRKKELGLYNILGMEKRHIAGVILSETLITAILCLALGIGLGIVFSKTFFLILERFLGTVNLVPFVIPAAGIRDTVLLFGGIFLLTALYNILQVRLSKPIELLHGGEAGEREPRAHWLMALIGLALLGSGYYMAVTIQDPIMAMGMFFVAVILVILGTYLLFMVGITAMLKLLKKNKRFYYKTRHFTAVSGMLYRMKQNAAGLASICILFTCLLVTVSTTFCLYTGVEDIIRLRNPRDINWTFTGAAPEDMARFRENAERICAENSVTPENLQDYSAWDFGTVRRGNDFAAQTAEDESTYNPTITYAYFKAFTPEEYNAFAGTGYELGPDELLLIDPDDLFTGDTLTLFGKEYKVTEASASPDDLIATDMRGVMGVNFFGLVINDPELLNTENPGQMKNPNLGVSTDSPWLDATYHYAFDIPGHDNKLISDVGGTILDWFVEDHRDWECMQVGAGSGLSSSYNDAAGDREDLQSLYGGIFFLGLFMGALFLLGTVLIMYYKQVSEGYEDARRFDIMQKVGMSHHEVKSSIHSQVLMVFFLPLLTALVHLGFAFPMLRKILMLMQMSNYQLILMSTGGTVLVFGLVYLIIYLLTARTYYRIVKSAN